MFRKLMLIITILFSFFMFSCGDSNNKSNEMKQVKPQAKVDIPASFSMAGTWTADYKSQKLKITLNEDNKGTISFAGNIAEIKLLKWEGEKLSESRMNLGLYIYSRDKSKFQKGSARMYNPGYGLKLKMVFNGNDQFSVYNGLYLDGEKIVKDDGRMILKRS